MPDSLALDVDLSGLGIRLTGVPDALAERLRADWSGFAGRLGGEHFLEVEVSAEPEGAETSPFDPKRMEGHLTQDRAVYRLPEGTIAVGAGGSAALRLGPSTGERQFFALVNLLCAACAWRLPHVSAALLHAAGIVLDGRAFVLVGPEGAGKTTWVRIAGRAGARVVSDDLVVVRVTGESVSVLGSPFRSQQYGTAGRGAWPLAAFLFPVHARFPSFAPVRELVAHARLVANLPYVGEGLGVDDRAAALIARLVRDVPVRVFGFAPDESFVPLLRGFDPLA